jgi:hypothetical protein
MTVTPGIYAKCSRIFSSRCLILGSQTRSPFAAQATKLTQSAAAETKWTASASTKSTERVFFSDPTLRVRAMVTCPAWVAAAEESSSASDSWDSATSQARASLENELFQVVVRFLPSHAVGVANHRGDGVDDRLGDGASDFGWKPAEVVPLLRAEGNRVIAVVVNPVAGPDLTILAVARWNVVSFWLWEELPNRRFRGHKWRSVIGSKSGKACRHLAEGCFASEARAISAWWEESSTPKRTFRSALSLPG